MIQIIPGVSIRTGSTRHSRCQLCNKSISKLDNRVRAVWPWNGNWHILCYYKQMNDLPMFTTMSTTYMKSDKSTTNRVKYVKEFYKKKYCEAIVIDAL